MQTQKEKTIQICESLKNTPSAWGLVILFSFLFAFLTFVFILSGPAFAQSESSDTSVPPKPPTSFKYFPIATELQPDKPVRGSVITPQNAYVYKIEITPAKQLQVSAQIRSSSSKTQVTLGIYDMKGKLLAQGKKSITGAEETVEAFYYKGYVSGESSVEIVYIEILNSSTDSSSNIDSYSFTPKLNAMSDAQKGYDAADNFDKSMELSGEGEYTNNHIGYNACGKTQYCSTDSKDVYKISGLKNDKNLKFTLNPSTGLPLTVSIADETKSIISTTDIPAGEVGSISYSPDQSTMAYLVVDADAEADSFGTYSITVAFEAPEPEPQPEPEPEPAPEVKKSFIDTIIDTLSKYYLYFIGGGITLVLIIVVLIIFIIRRRKKNRSPQNNKKTPRGPSQDIMGPPEPKFPGTQNEQSSESRSSSVETGLESAGKDITETPSINMRKPNTRTPEAPRDPLIASPQNQPLGGSPLEEELPKEAPLSSEEQKISPLKPETPPQPKAYPPTPPIPPRVPSLKHRPQQQPSQKKGSPSLSSSKDSQDENIPPEPFHKSEKDVSGGFLPDDDSGHLSTDALDDA